MTVRMRHTRSHTANRRSHHALVMPRLSKCASCGAMRVPHRACPSCGMYRGRVVVDVVAATKKRQEKRASKKTA